MLSPVRNQSEDSEMTSSTPGHATTNGSCAVETQQLELNGLHALGNDVMSNAEHVCPPKAGFVPRMSGIKFREDIRKTLHLCCEQTVTGPHPSSNSVSTGLKSRLDLPENAAGDWQTVSSTADCEPPQLALYSYPNGVESDCSSYEVKTEDQVPVPGHHQVTAPFHATTQPHNGYFQTVLPHNGYSPDPHRDWTVSPMVGVGNGSHSVTQTPACVGHTQNRGHQTTRISASQLVVNGACDCNLKGKPSFDTLRSEPEL